MANKARINYWIDVGLVITFILSALTGLVKWPGLFRLTGIRHTDLPMLEISFIHDWSGLIMIALVLTHIILHFKWMVAMTKCLFKRKKSRGKMSKTIILALAMLMVFAVIGCSSNQALVQREQVTSQVTSQANNDLLSNSDGEVSCPRGVTDDPYPGDCWQYIDKDNDGFCDLGQ